MSKIIGIEVAKYNRRQRGSTNRNPNPATVIPWKESKRRRSEAQVIRGDEAESERVGLLGETERRERYGGHGLLIEAETESERSERKKRSAS